MIDLISTLKNLGLEEQEAKTYLALLSLKEATATKLTERANIGRVNMYQITNRLIEKGLVSYVVKNNVRYFTAADHETLLKDLEEKQEQLEKILPQLKARQKETKVETKVEIYRGREGINTILKMIIRNGKQYYIMGGAQEACSIFEIENKIFVRRAEKLKLQGKILGRKQDEFFIGKNEEYRFIPEHLISSTSMMLWDNKTAIFVWSEPYYSILIENEDITKSNLSAFNYLWKQGEIPSKSDKNQRKL